MTDVVPTATELHIARQGIYFQLRNNTELGSRYESLAEAIDELGLGDFIENQVQVIASCRAWVRVTENNLRESEERLNNGG